MIIINLYCILVVASDEQLKSLDFFLVTLQSFSDLVFTGILGLIDYLLDLWAAFIYICSYGTFYDDKLLFIIFVIIN